jgi:hypothetical protein
MIYGLCEIAGGGRDIFGLGYGHVLYASKSIEFFFGWLSLLVVLCLKYLVRPT